MALGSEARREWDGYMRHWRSDWGKEFPTVAENILAIADHLAACESLLREVQKAGMFDSGQLGLFSIAVDALLGPPE